MFAATARRTGPRTLSWFSKPSYVAPVVRTFSYQARIHALGSQSKSRWGLGIGAAFAFGFAAYQSQKEKLSGSEVIHERFPYVLIGTGPAVLAAAEQIREKDENGEILIIGEYKSVPYTRKALITSLLGREDELLTLDRQPEEWFEDTKIKYYRNVAVWNIDPSSKMVHLEGNKAISFEKCLIATGSVPTSPKFEIEDGAPIISFHTIGEVEKLKATLEEGNKKIAIIGSNNWSCTLASVISAKYRQSNINTEQIISGNGILTDMLPPYLAEYALNRHARRKNLHVTRNCEVVSVGKNDEGMGTVELDNGDILEVDQIVYVPDLLPNSIFSGPIEVERTGIVANRELQIASDCYAAGEAASHYDPGYGRRTLVGENNEILSGQVAGRNMVNDKNSIFGTDIVEQYKVAGIKFSVVGRCDASLRTSSAWLRPLTAWEDESYESDEYKRGIVYYLQEDDKIVGVLLWNMPDEEEQKEDRAISVIKGSRRYPADSAKTAIVISDKDAMKD